MLHFGELPLDEGAARGLLLNWSIYHQVASPIVLLGIPDARALFFIPVTLYWPGSLIAPRVLWIALCFSAVWMLYRWIKHRLGDEQALLTCGLLLIAPLTITQIDTLGGGIFLLFCFAVAHWMEHRYELKGHALNGWFYGRFLWAAFTVSVHPAGLAYPAAMLWLWWRDKDKPARLKKQNAVGLAVALLLLLLLQAGWHAVPWLGDPRVALTTLFHSTELDPFPPAWEPWLIGLLLLIVAAFSFRRLMADTFSATLSLSLVFGLLAANVDWAYLVLVFVLLWGMDGLIRLNEQIGGQGLLAQRGLVLVVLLGLSLMFTRADYAYGQIVRSGVKSAHAILLQEVAVEVEALGKFARILSQWPGQTMMVCKCDVLILPPGSEDPKQLLDWLDTTRATHMVFDPRDPDNRLLTEDVSMLTDHLKTLFVNEAGVIVGVVEAIDRAAEEARKAREEEELPAPAEGSESDTDTAP